LSNEAISYGLAPKNAILYAILFVFISNNQNGLNVARKRWVAEKERSG
jgi:predicted anti-sigma-YlaC factor YlaD